MRDRNPKPMHKRIWRPRAFEEPDYGPEWPERMCGLWDFFTDDEFLQGYMGMATFTDIFGGAGKAATGFAFEDSNFAERFPTLFLVMSSLKDDAGNKRQTCTLTMVAEDGVLKVGLKERDRGLSLWTSAESLGGAFAALEEALQERPSRWRKSEWKGRK